MTASSAWNAKRYAIIPKAVRFPKSFFDIKIETWEDNCHHAATTIVRPKTNWWILGNIIFPIGVFVDLYTGSAWIYPDEVTINIDAKENC